MKYWTKFLLYPILAILATAGSGVPIPASAQTAHGIPADLPPINWAEASSSALEDTFIIKKNFGLAAVEIVGLNVLIWSYDRYIRAGEGRGFRIGFNSWQENLTNGFEWDDNNFSTNQFAHPYHGNLYFNAARSNGYSFWESVPFAFAGSYGWEFFGETHHPSMNDWIATSIGGSALGEMLHRFSMMIRDNTARGSSRKSREIAGFLVDPVGGLNRMIRGDWKRVYPNSPDRFANAYRSRMDFGFRTVGEDEIADTDTTRTFMQFDFNYGDPFQGDMESPYDHFTFAMQLNFSEKNTIGLVRSSGLLGGTVLKESEGASHILAAYHYFDFVNNNQLEFGAQSVGAALLSRFTNVWGMEARTGVSLNAIILGGTSTDYVNFSGRDYDYGPGMSMKFGVDFTRNGFSYFRLLQELGWIHAVNGNHVDHLISATELTLGVPVYNNIGLGFEYILYLDDRKYDDYDDVSVRHPQTRLYATWAFQ